jgi:membrane protease YdiL (CAAX protease family)
VTRLFWFGTAAAAVVPVLGTAIFYVLAPTRAAALAAFAFSKLFLVLWPAVWSAGVERRPLGELAGETNGMRGIGLGIATGLLFGIVAAAGYGLFYASLLEPFREPLLARISDWGSVERYWAWAAAISIAHSLVEEIYWRSFLYARLERAMPPVPAALAAGALFSMHHGVMYASIFSADIALVFTLGTALAGAVWCRIYARGGGLPAAWISHALADAFLFAIGARFIGL